MRTRTVSRSDYHEYIRSQAWEDKKAQYRRSGLSQECHGCGAVWVQLHHRSYKYLGNEKLTDLVPVCGACHQAIHGAAAGSKLGLWKVTRRILKGIRVETGHALTYPNASP